MSIEIYQKNEIEEVLKNEVCQRHSYFQLKYFIIGKEPTLQAKMWQCIRELKTRKESLDNILLQIEENNDNMELLRISLQKSYTSSSDSELDLKEKEIKKRQIRRKIDSAYKNTKKLEEQKKYLEEESLFFLETFKNISKIEELKDFDDLECQKEYWSEKLTQKLNLKMLTSNQLDTELIETIFALPDEMPIKNQVIANLNVRHANMLRQLKETANLMENKKNQGE